MKSPMSTPQTRTWSNTDLVKAYLYEADNNIFKMPIVYIKNSVHMLDYGNYWIDKKRRQALTLQDMKEILQGILNKLIYCTDLILDNMSIEEDNSWAFDEVDYIQKVMHNLINGNDYYSTGELDLLDCVPSNLNLMTALAQLEKILLDITSELLECETDPVKLTNFINCTFKDILIK